MRLHSPAFEKSLEREVRGAIRGDARLRKQYRRTKDRQRVLGFVYFGRLVFSAILASSALTVFKQTGHLSAALAIITLWTLAGSAFLSSMLVIGDLSSARQYRSDIQAFLLLPISDFTIFLFLRDRFLWLHLGLLFDLLVALGALAFQLHLPWPAYVAVPFIAALTWAVSASLGFFLTAKTPWFPSSWLALGLILIGLAWLFGNKLFGHQMIAMLDFAAPAINLFSPTGWPLKFFDWMAGAPAWPALAGLVPILGLLWSYRSCVQQIGARLVYREPEAIPRPPEQVPPSMASAEASSLETGRPLGVTAIEEGILSRDCLELPTWDQEPTQRLLWRWLTPREQILASVIFSRPLPIVRPWLHILKYLFIGLLAWQVMRFLTPDCEFLIFGGLCLVVLLFILAQSWPSGAAFRTIGAFGLRISLLAPYPVAFRDISHLLLKCTLIQLPMVAGVVVFLTFIYVASHGVSWPDSALMALTLSLRLVLIFTATRLGLLVLNFSSMSNDTSRSWPKTIVTLAVSALEVIVFIGLLCAVVFLPDNFAAWLCGAILIGTQYGLLRVVGWLWKRGAIDFIGASAR